jgi:hypothetical protein
MHEPKVIFDVIRSLIPRFDTKQVGSIDSIVIELNKENLTNRQISYILATTYHETAYSFLPVHEYGSDARFKNLYDIEGSNPALATRLGNVMAGDGVKFAGRGYVQITGRSNYLKMQNLLGIPLIDQPDLALRPEHAARILVQGMVRGMFTGIKLDTYNHEKNDYKYFLSSRRIVNGTDRAHDIARHATVLLKAF